MQPEVDHRWMCQAASRDWGAGRIARMARHVLERILGRPVSETFADAFIGYKWVDSFHAAKESPERHLAPLAASLYDRDEHVRLGATLLLFELFPHEVHGFVHVLEGSTPEMSPLQRFAKQRIADLFSSRTGHHSSPPKH